MVYEYCTQIDEGNFFIEILEQFLKIKLFRPKIRRLSSGSLVPSLVRSKLLLRLDDSFQVPSFLLRFSVSSLPNSRLKFSRPKYPEDSPDTLPISKQESISVFLKILCDSMPVLNRDYKPTLCFEKKKKEGNFI